ncbi:hypothetical protein H6P81_001379 [Aristolochia fimbriata]|uniref:Cucumisin n=1 Tax=Aristolochia fimbriata TaxID=158543 RepID=A0AAV7FAL2_ARIFI|nr:hypothetical protein H6P81_001379 [Aristolochia fimbriata]
MANVLQFSPLAFFLSLLMTTLTLSLALDAEKKVYIVYMGAKPQNELLAVNQHTAVLQQVLQTSLVQDSLVYSYGKSFNGFAATLTEEESKRIAGLDGVTSVFPNGMYKLHTTRSWDFLNFTKSIKRVPGVESNIVVGVFDTGAWPESKSFNDQGLGPLPQKWRGACATKNFTCNNKIIGARVYPDTVSDSARDENGHGSHTASTIAGRSVHGVSLYGLAKGDARGGVPLAKIAVYKVCSSLGCSFKDILAAFDDAIADGVDIISLSLGPDSAATHFFEDPISIGSFHAMAKGILISNSAGNSGPSWRSTASVAPWVLTVAATSIDRRFISKLALGNGKTLTGNALNTFPSHGTMFPFISGANARASQCDIEAAWTCSYGCLDPKLVKGHILFCEGGQDGTTALQAGALGLVTQSRLLDVAFGFPLPAAAIDLNQMVAVHDYLNKTRNPRARIFHSEAVLDKKAPAVAYFSSRGPNTITPQIIKPDISAPGVDIFAAWSPHAPLTTSPLDKRSVNYHIISGTSMACPHATAAAAYVKTFHPDWSPTAIKSALMTTATPISRKRNMEGEFAYGSGNINPVKATNPGLVFDASTEDYIQMLCSIGYTSKQVRIISGDSSSCLGKPKGSVNDLNYPSVAYKVKPNTKSFSATFSRTVTNVGDAKSVYTSRIRPRKAGDTIEVRTEPRVLEFTELNEKKEFKVVIVGSNPEQGSSRSLSIEWSDGKHVVRVPVVVYDI